MGHESSGEAQGFIPARLVGLDELMIQHMLGHRTKTPEVAKREEAIRWIYHSKFRDLYVSTKSPYILP